MRYSVPAVRAVQNGQELFLFVLPAKTLKALQSKSRNSTRKSHTITLIKVISVRRKRIARAASHAIWKLQTRSHQPQSC